MLGRDRHWDPENYPDTTDAGVFRPVVRNVGILVVMCVAVAWMVSSISGRLSEAVPGASRGQSIDSSIRPGSSGGRGAYEISIAGDANGHFVVNAMTNGKPVRFLVDTGASGVLLTHADARNAGIPVNSLQYADRVGTANGDIRVARAKLREIRIAGLIVNDMDVWVTRAPLPISLLGMTFLNRLESYEAEGNQLILRW